MFTSYCERIGHYCRCQTENYPTEEKFFAAIDRGLSKTKPLLVMLDSRGRTLATEQFADWLRRERDRSAQLIIFAVGPANGWSDAARTRANLLLSLSPMTLPHELAAVVLVEQVYRAFTIIEGHPYHLGHA
jgi:23S rRNA (pseudouridine1915-N3)-methyltransferase